MFKNFFKGISRAFTLPRATRDQIDHSQIIQEALPFIRSEVASAIISSVNGNVHNPAEADLLAGALQKAVDQHIFIK